MRFDLRPLRGKKTLVGYVYGGIQAFPKEFPYQENSPQYHSGNVPTRINEKIIGVYFAAPPSK